MLNIRFAFGFYLLRKVARISGIMSGGHVKFCRLSTAGPAMIKMPRTEAMNTSDSNRVHVGN